MIFRRKQSRDIFPVINPWIAVFMDIARRGKKCHLPRKVLKVPDGVINQIVRMDNAFVASEDNMAGRDA